MSYLNFLVFVYVHCFLLKMMKLYKGTCSAWISRTSAEFFFLIDWRHKRFKNTIDLFLFYGEHFYGFSESVFWKTYANGCELIVIFLQANNHMQHCFDLPEPKLYKKPTWVMLVHSPQTTFHRKIIYYGQKQSPRCVLYVL